jgi:uncharacterized membrane protein YfcA
MDILTIAFLAGAGVIAGIIAAMVGGAAVVIYPALIATGVPPHLAAVSNLASIMPATMLAALSDRSQLPPFDRSFLGLIAASIVGAGIGAVCLLLTPERMFAQIVPLLLGFATLLFAYSERISRWLRTRAEGRGHPIAFNVASLKVVLPVSFYGGYFGAGVGILMLGVFSLATGGDYRSANVAKNSCPASMDWLPLWSLLRTARCCGRKRWRLPPERSEADWLEPMWRASSREMSSVC